MTILMMIMMISMLIDNINDDTYNNGNDNW